MLLRTAATFILAFVGIIALHSLFFKDRIAEISVSILNILFIYDYERALSIWDTYVRGNYDEIYFLAIALMFLLLMSVYFAGFTKYFRQINRAINSMTDENSPDAALDPELYEVEHKINTVKHTLASQNAEIRESAQKKNDLIMYLAHDLKTPLASVIGYLSLLDDAKDIPDEQRQKYVSIALDKAERLEDLINEFFEITRFNLTGITLQYKTVDLVRLLMQLIYEFEPMLKEKNLSCKLSAPDQLSIKCDPDKLQRVFDNLLKNAVLYSYEGSEAVITVKEIPDNKVNVEFINCGEEIPKEKLDRIFEQFYRLDSSRSTQGGGAGLGLAIAKQIVTLHGGTVTAACANEKIVFDVTLPLS